jgi:multisubunit Na+/H+ antiporter MnhE subunit
MNRIAAGVLIVWRLFAAIARSGWQISWRILRPARGFAPGFVEYRFEPMGPAATTALACLICLTPGTTAVDVDAAAGRMRLHLLDAGEGACEAALQEIRVLFEGAVRVLFAEEEMS